MFDKVYQPAVVTLLLACEHLRAASGHTLHAGACHNNLLQVMFVPYSAMQLCETPDAVDILKSE